LSDKLLIEALAKLSIVILKHRNLFLVGDETASWDVIAKKLDEILTKWEYDLEH